MLYYFKMTWCNFEKLYTSEPKDYHLLTTCLFYKEKYLKTSFGVVRDESTTRQKQFIKAIETHASNYDKGYWNDKTRLRIYFDNSLFEIPQWKPVIEKYSKHPFFQFVKYDIPTKKDPEFKKFHLGLIGTLVRFYPFFHKDKNINMISVIDLDVMYSNKWKDEMEKFAKSDYKLHCFSSYLIVPFYGSIIPGISDEVPKGYWLTASLFTSKITLPSFRWNRIPQLMESKGFLTKLRFLDAFKMGLFYGQEGLKIDQFYEDFEYGLDEMLLNHIFDYYITKDKLSVMVTKVKAKPNMDYFKKRILDYLKWNTIKTKRMLEVFKAFRVKNIEELEKFFNNTYNFTNIVNVFKQPKTLKILEGLQFDRRLLYLILNFNQDDFKAMHFINQYVFNINI